MDVEAITARLIEAGDEWADKNAAASLLEETRKSVLSQIAVRCMRDGDSATKAEKVAAADPEYRDHIMSMVEARQAANKARVRYDSGKTFSELVRTKEATNRAEMSLR